MVLKLHQVVVTILLLALVDTLEFLATSAGKLTNSYFLIRFDTWRRFENNKFYINQVFNFLLDWGL